MMTQTHSFKFLPSSFFPCPLLSTSLHTLFSFFFFFNQNKKRKMKFTPSLYVSSSTTITSTNSFTQNICKSQINNFGCFLGLISRILRSKSTLPKHPSDPIKITKKQESSLKTVNGSTTPNLVARLMGLESMPPEFSSDSRDLRGDIEEMEGLYSRAKTSFSFKHTPEFFELEDDDFFVPSKPHKNTKKRAVKLGNSEVGVKGQKHRRRRDKCRTKQGKYRDDLSNQRVFSIEDRLSLKFSAQTCQKADNNIIVTNKINLLSPLKETPTSRKDVPDGIKARKRKKKDRCLVDSSKEAIECESENLSPVSVLDHTEFIPYPEAASSAKEQEKLSVISHGRKDLDLVGRDFTCDKTESNGWSKRDERERGEVVGLRKRGNTKHEVLCRVYRLAEAEIIANTDANNSRWKYRGMLTTPELEDTGTRFGQLIFDHLLTELVHQLLELQPHHF